MSDETMAKVDRCFLRVKIGGVRYPCDLPWGHEGKHHSQEGESWVAPAFRWTWRSWVALGVGQLIAWGVIAVLHAVVSR